MNSMNKTRSKMMSKSIIGHHRIKTSPSIHQLEPSLLYANVFLLESVYSGRNVFIQKYLDGKFKNDTTVWQFKDRSLQFQQIKIKLHTWDTNGQVNSKSMVLSSIKMWVSKKITNIGIIFYDITQKKSLEEANNFLKQWKQINPLSLPSVIIVASKVDLIQKYGRVISSLQGLQYAKKNRVLYLQSSSKFDVTHIFKNAINIMMSQLGMSNKQLQEQQQKQIKAIQKKIEQNSSILAQKWKIIYLEPLIKNLQNLLMTLSGIQYQENLQKVIKLYKLIKIREEKITSLSMIQFSIKFYNSSQNQKNKKGQEENIKKQDNMQQMKRKLMIQNLQMIKQNLTKQIDQLSKQRAQQIKDSKIRNKTSNEFINNIHQLTWYINSKYAQCLQFFSHMWQSNPQISQVIQISKKNQEEETAIQPQLKNQIKTQMLCLKQIIQKMLGITTYIDKYHQKIFKLIGQNQQPLKQNNKQGGESVDKLITYFIYNKFGIVDKDRTFSKNTSQTFDIFANEHLLQANLARTQQKVKQEMKQCQHFLSQIRKQHLKNKSTTHEKIIVELQMLKHNKKMIEQRYGLKMDQFEKFLSTK